MMEPTVGGSRGSNSCGGPEGDGSNYNLRGEETGSRFPPSCALPEPTTLNAVFDARRSRCSCCSCGNALGKDTELGSRFDSRNSESEDGIRRGRKWKYFQGNNHFYCGGRIMTAPSIRYCSLSLALILITFGLFIAFDAPFLMKRLTVAIPIISSILFVLVIVNMLRASCSDPGILPRASLAEVEDMERSYGNTAATYRPPPRTKDIVVNGQTVKSKYCFTCKMFRPPRASHCSICDNCVERFDHHCPFLGNCVGRRNYRSFYFFVVSLSLLAVLILSCSVTHLALLAKDNGNFLEALRDSPTSAIVILISFFGMWTVIGLAGFHTYLIAVEQTTNEDIKGLFGRPNSKNPYSRGSTCSNCCFILCGPNPPSLLDPRGYATADFLDSIQQSKSGQIPHFQQPIRAQPPPSVNSTFGPTHCASNPPKPVDISHLTPTHIQPLKQFQEPKAGTFPDTKVGKDDSLKGTTSNNGLRPYSVRYPTTTNDIQLSQRSSDTAIAQGQKESRTESLSMVRLDVKPQHLHKASSNSGGFSNSLGQGQRKASSNKTLSPSNGSVGNSSASNDLDRLTMINSPLHLDPVM